jgi:hypothetical protein
MVSQRLFPSAISLLRRQQKAYDAQATSLDLHMSGSPQQVREQRNGEGKLRSHRDSRFLQLRNVTTSCEGLYPGGQGGWRRNSRARSAAIVTVGYPGGGSPIPDLFSTGMLQSGRTYNPMQVTHHDCEWVRGAVVGSEQVPTWPLKDDKGNIICNRQKLAKDFHPCAGLSRQGAAIHFGELGCYK